MRLAWHGGRPMRLDECGQPVWSDAGVEREYQPMRWFDLQRRGHLLLVSERGDRLWGRGSSRVAFESLALDSGVG
jgi:hypothetical protein